MNIFVYSDLNDHLREVLTNALPADQISFKENIASANEAAFRDAEALMGNPPSSWFDVTNLRLSFWQLDSAGFDQYKHVKTGARVANMGDFFSLGCAETVLGGLLAIYRRIADVSVLQQQKKWVGRPLRSSMDTLTGKSVLILGAGTIAMSIKKMLGGFACSVKVAARTNPKADLRTKEAALEQAAKADIVINTLPGSAGQYVDAEFLRRLGKSAIYASVGRGSTTDESALIDALREEKLAGAVLDVTQLEPLPVTSPLWEMKNVILTQHTGGGYRWEDEGKVQQFLRNIERFKVNESLENEITLSEGY